MLPFLAYLSFVTVDPSRQGIVEVDVAPGIVGELEYVDNTGDHPEIIDRGRAFIRQMWEDLCKSTDDGCVHGPYDIRLFYIEYKQGPYCLGTLVGQKFNVKIDSYSIQDYVFSCNSDRKIQFSTKEIVIK